MAVAAGVVRDAEGAEASSGDALAVALEANRELAELAERQRAEIAGLREQVARLLERDAERDAELEELRAGLAVLQRMLFGRSSEKSSPEPPAGGDDDGGGGARDRGNGKDVKRGPGARAGRRDYSRLPRFEVSWDFPGAGTAARSAGSRSAAGGSRSGEQLDWQVIVRVSAHCRRRYRRACSCRVPATVTAPGPPKAVGKGLFSNGFIAMLLTERYVAGRSQNSLVTGLARHGAEISPATLTGTCAQAGTLLAPLADAITARSRDSWHLHADETRWRVFAPRDGGGPAKWWLWVSSARIPAASSWTPPVPGAVLARHAGIDQKTGQLSGRTRRRRAAPAGHLQRLLQRSTARRAARPDGLVNLYCWAQYAEPGIMRNLPCGAVVFPSQAVVPGRRWLRSSA